MKNARLVAFVIAATLAAVAPASAGEAGAMTAVVTKALAAFNAGNVAGFAAACSQPAVVIDDFPPHVWQGATACTDWMRDFVAYTKAHHQTNSVVTLSAPQNVAVDGSTGYVVYTTTYTYKQDGKPVKEAGVFTVALRNVGGKWSISGWAWADR